MRSISEGLQKSISRFALIVYFGLRNLCLVLVNKFFNPKSSIKYGAQLFFLKHIKKNDTILDIGCNRGFLTYSLASEAGHIDAYDISGEFISYAKKHNSLPNITYLVNDAESIVNLCKKHYNVALLGAVLSFIDNRKDFLLKLASLADIILIRETKFDNDILALVAEDLGIKKSAFKEFRKTDLIGLLKTCNYRIIEDFDTYDIFIAATSLK